MRQTVSRLAALSLAVLAPGAALAFDMQTLGSSSMPASPQFTDPYGVSDEVGDVSGASKPTAPHGGMLGTPGGLQFGVTTSGARPGDEALGWTNPQPGRLTR